jgi:hypothetical protein
MVGAQVIELILGYTQSRRQQLSDRVFIVMVLEDVGRVFEDALTDLQ